MKTLVFMLFFTATLMYGQNLVYNGSFEIGVSCEESVDSAFLWSTLAGNPVIMDSCNPNPIYGIPFNEYGYETPKDASRYSALRFDGFGMRDYIYCGLATPTFPGTTYYVSFSVSLADSSCIAFNNVCVFLSTDTINVASIPTASVSQFCFDSIVFTSAGWITFNTSFVADSFYDVLTIGNPYPDSLTKKQETGICSGADISVYYFDNICISSDPSDCDIATSIQVNEIYPEPHLVEIRNLFYELVDESYNGIQIRIYSDGTTRKILVLD